MSRENVTVGMAEGLLKETGDPDPRRTAARRTAWLLAALAGGVYLLFFFLGSFR